MLSPPEVLIAFRAFAAPAIFVLACFGFPGPVLAAVVLAAFASDVLDGIVARRMGVATPRLRHADTVVDTVFYAAAAVALWIAVPAAFAGVGWSVSLLIVLHVSRATFELAKFGRLSAYHMWSSKALGIVIVFTMTSVFLTGRPTGLVAPALWMGMINELEGFAVSAVLSVWAADVPSLVHALRRARPREIDRAVAPTA
jgi:phosphatidylglycerophosphate synthase